MTKPAGVADLLRAIHRLPLDSPVHDPRKWYLTQKEHWIGWLSEYDGPGAYGRKTGVVRDARYAYNHIVEPKMLLWLIAAAGVKASRVELARRAASKGTSMAQQSAIVRRAVPWEAVAAALWDSKGSSAT